MATRRLPVSGSPQSLRGGGAAGRRRTPFGEARGIFVPCAPGARFSPCRSSAGLTAPHRPPQGGGIHWTAMKPGPIESVLQLEGDLAVMPLVICTHSQAALATLEAGAGAQTTVLGAAVWRGDYSWRAPGTYDTSTCSGFRPTVGSLVTKRRTCWRRRSPACHRKTRLWTSAPSPGLWAAPPPRPGVAAGPTASSGGQWATGCRSRSPSPVMTP